MSVEPLRLNEAIAPLPRVEGGFHTVLADPPWRFQNRTGKVAPEHRRLDRYSTLDLDAICRLPVVDAVARDAHLYLWVPNALLPDGLRVMESWGFRYVSNLVWAKRRKDGGPDGRGVGFYFRNVTELVLFGVRGSQRTLAPARSQVNLIETRKREHSRKPDEQYALIESCSPPLPGTVRAPGSIRMDLLGRRVGDKPRAPRPGAQGLRRRPDRHAALRARLAADGPARAASRRALRARLTAEGPPCGQALSKKGGPR